MIDERNMDVDDQKTTTGSANDVHMDPNRDFSTLNMDQKQAITRS